MRRKPVVTPYLKAKALLENEDFLAQCAEDGDDPADVIGMRNFGAADKCSRPMEIERFHPKTGELEMIRLPCGTSRSDVCPECAEMNAKLRFRQIMTVLEKPGISAALFTVTAPSFGKVHNAQWTTKDEFAASKKQGEELEHFRMTTMRKRSACPCGDRHTFRDGLIGTPIGTYDYLKEVMWSENLPRLMKALVRQLRRTVRSLGASTGQTVAGIREENNFSIFTVYERQKRGALHAHNILVLHGSDARLMPLLVKELERFQSPTAQLPEDVLAEYLRPETLAEFGADVVKAAIPRSRWKGKKAVAATRFGSTHDVRPLTPTQAEDGETLHYGAAAGYVAKYLTKGSASYAPGPLSDLSKRQREHFQRVRTTAVRLLGTRVTQLAAAYLFDERDEALESLDLEARSRPRLSKPGELLSYLEGRTVTRKHVARALLGSPRLSPQLASDEAPEQVRLARELLQAFVNPDDTSDLNLGLVPVHVTDAVPRYLRSLKIRLNKLADNGGFTGSASLRHNWTTLKALKDARRDKYLTEHPEDELAYIWGEVRGAELIEAEDAGRDIWDLLVAERLPDEMLEEVNLWEVMTRLHELDLRKRPLGDIRDAVEELQASHSEPSPMLSPASCESFTVWLGTRENLTSLERF